MKKSSPILFTLLMLVAPAYAIGATANTIYLPIVMYTKPPVPTAPPTGTATNTPTITPTPQPTDTPQPTTTNTPIPTPTKGNCDSHYPTVCIPPPPPDLDCSDIPYRSFTVLQPDPHTATVSGGAI